LFVSIIAISFVGSFRTMRNIDAIVRDGTETANSMDDMIKESIKQIEVSTLLPFFFGFLSSTEMQ
jgi:hypothetical protein